MSKFDTETLFSIAIVTAALFVALFVYMVLVVNHQRNIERDKIMFQHCSKIQDQGVFFPHYECVESRHQ